MTDPEFKRMLEDYLYPTSYKGSVPLIYAKTGDKCIDRAATLELPCYAELKKEMI